MSHTFLSYVAITFKIPTIIAGARRWARARRRTICSPARCSACRRWRRRGGLQVHNPASWRCVPRCVSAFAKARWPELPPGPQPGVVGMSSSARVGVGEGLVACSSINFGQPGALLGSSVAFGSGCGQALPGVPRKAPLCSYDQHKSGCGASLPPSPISRAHFLLFMCAPHSSGTAQVTVTKHARRGAGHVADAPLSPRRSTSVGSRMKICRAQSLATRR